MYKPPQNSLLPGGKSLPLPDTQQPFSVFIEHALMTHIYCIIVSSKHAANRAFRSRSASAIRAALRSFCSFVATTFRTGTSFGARISSVCHLSSASGTASSRSTSSSESSSSIRIIASARRIPSNARTRISPRPSVIRTSPSASAIITAAGKNSAIFRISTAICAPAAGFPFSSFTRIFTSFVLP